MIGSQLNMWPGVKINEVPFGPANQGRQGG